MYLNLFYNNKKVEEKTNRWNSVNIRKSVRYECLEIITGKKKNTIKIYFNRNNLNILNNKIFLKYLKDNIELKKFIDES